MKNKSSFVIAAVISLLIASTICSGCAKQTVQQPLSTSGIAIESDSFLLDQKQACGNSLLADEIYRQMSPVDLNRF